MAGDVGGAPGAPPPVGAGMICAVSSITPVRSAGNRVIQGLLVVGAVIDRPRGGDRATALGRTGWGLAVTVAYAIAIVVVGALNAAAGAWQPARGGPSAEPAESR